METGGITLVKGDLRGILKVSRLSQRTMGNIRQNLFFAFVYNTLGVLLLMEPCIRFSGCCVTP
jgi:Cu+-exporting ATPase